MIEPPPREPLGGREPFVGIDGVVEDFWRFAIPDLRVNNVRGWFAEYLLWRALGVQRPVRVEWDAFDVRWEGIRIEVKSSGYLQVWKQRELSKLVFSGLSARSWGYDELTMAEERTHNADVYAFAVQSAETHDAYDPLDLSQWHFAVLSRTKLDAIGTRSLSWTRVIAEAGGETVFGDMQAAVRSAAAENLRRV